jgi:hypothetical protein
MEHNLFQENNPKRHKLIKPLSESATADKNNSKATLEMSEADVKSFVRDVKHLRECLLTALQLELSTIPPYLCALYTIKDGSSQQAGGLIRSVAVEEMLHMVLVSNILNAITDPKTIKPGQKLFNVKDLIPAYPTPLPGNIVPEMPKGQPPFKVHLRKFSKEAIDGFCTIERPSNPDESLTDPDAFDSIGQFYQAIRWGLERLNNKAIKAGNKKGIFIGDPQRQITPEHYYGSGGKILQVTDYETAKDAIDEIVGQGEGIDGTISAEQPMFGEGIEYAHYFKFQEIAYGRMYSANDTNFQMPVKSVPTGHAFDVSWSSVYNMKPNPKMKDYEGNLPLLEKAREFNKVYVQLLNNINDAVSGDPSALIKGITVMYDLKYKAIELLNIPLSNGECAGPTFEYVEL